MTEAILRDLTGGGTKHVLELARRHLDMDLAFLAEFTDGKQVYRGLAGDAPSFGWELNDGPELPETYCRMMTSGELSNAIADTSADALVADLPVTARARIGSYVGVPVHLPDGSLYGSLCTVNHDAHSVDQRDVKFLRLLADLVAVDLQAERDQDTARSRISALIDNRLIDIALQPIFDNHTGRMLGVEALSRFPSEYGPPDKVFAAAHQVGLGLELERLATQLALQVLPLLAPDQYLALNVSPAVAIELAASGDLTDVPLHRVVLEITEHAAVENYVVLRDTLALARADGLRIAIDDAGAGYASLHHIIELAPDVIKIDRSLIDGVSTDAARRSVVKAFVSLADDLGALVIAEGVEESPDLLTARNLGATATQGYLLARPSLDRADLQAWSRDGATPSAIGGP